MSLRFGVGTMTFIGLIATLFLGSQQIFRQVRKAKQRNQNISELIHFNHALEKYIYGSRFCHEIRQKTFNTYYTKTSFNKWKHQGQSTLSAGDQIGTIKIVSLEAQIDFLSPSPDLNINGEYLKKAVLQIKVALDGKKRDNHYYYDIPVLSTPLGVVKHCKEIKNAVEICHALSGKFDTTRGLCQHDDTCQIKGTFVKVDCVPSNLGCSSIFGLSTVNPLTGNSRCPPGVQARETSTISWNHYASCGKRCIQRVDNTAKWFTCLQCPGNPLPPPRGDESKEVPE